MGEIFLCLISINSPTGLARRGIKQDRFKFVSQTVQGNLILLFELITRIQWGPVLYISTSVKVLGTPKSGQNIVIALIASLLRREGKQAIKNKNIKFNKGAIWCKEKKLLPCLMSGVTFHWNSRFQPAIVVSSTQTLVKICNSLGYQRILASILLPLWNSNFSLRFLMAFKITVFSVNLVFKEELEMLEISDF